MGFVKKENFDLKDPDSRYSREEFATQRLENKAIRSRVEKEERSKEEAAKAYDEWMVIKDLKEQALKCLSFLPPPTSSSYSSSPLNSCTSSALNISRSTLMSPIVPASIKNNASIKNQLTAIDKSPGSTFQHAISVGRALKQVDRGLLNDWIGWCKGLNLSTSTLMVIWDFLPPKCCDVHSAAYSQVKSVLTVSWT